MMTRHYLRFRIFSLCVIDTMCAHVMYQSLINVKRYRIALLITSNLILMS